MHHVLAPFRSARLGVGPPLPRSVRLGVGLVLALLAIVATAWLASDVDAQPANEAFACEQNGANLSWTDDGASRYWVYRTTPDDPTETWIGRSLGGTTFTDTNPVPGAQYLVHYAGIPRTPCVDVGGPIAPGPALTCSAEAGVITWNDAGKDRYWIYRSTPDDPTYTWRGRTLGETTFTDPNPVVGARYQVRFAGARPFECSVEAEVQNERPAFSCSVSGSDIEWTDHGQTKYWVYRSVDGGSTYAWLGRTTGDTTFTDPSPVVGARYQVHYAGIPRVDCNDGDAPSVSASLQKVADCSALLDRLRTEGGERVGPYGLQYDGSGGPMIDILVPLPAVTVTPLPSATPRPLATPSPAQPGAPEAAPRVDQDGVDFSETNVQEAGIDEPDIIKTDGNRILVVASNVFSVVDTRAAEAVVVGQLELENDMWASEMLITGDRALLFANQWGGAGYYGSRTVIIDIDFSDEAQPTITSRMEIEGQYLSARLVNGIAQVAIRANPTPLPYEYAYSVGEEQALATNQRLIAESELEDWLPSYTVESESGEANDGLLAPCDSVYVPSIFSGFGSLSLVSIDMAAPLNVASSSSVMASGETMYASNDSVYLATNNWFAPGLTRPALDALSQSYSTSIHRFAIAGADVEYSASGSVRGHLLNQFSLSEHEGNLRVATTDGSPWGAGPTSESFVHVLEQQDDELVVVGSVGEMGRGETIRSVRFVGDVAYVVTFRQTDPFYTVDLSEPTAPVVRGELKITGYSGYLHPIGDELVLGIGREATEDGRITGAKLSLFDVSDLDDPTELDSWVLPDAYTGAEWDHRAFLWWAPENLAVMPITSWANNFWGSITFNVDRATGITAGGTIQHLISNGGDDEIRCEPSEDGGEICSLNPLVYEYDPIIRNLIIGDELWSMSTSTLQSNLLSDLSTTQQLSIGPR